MHRRIISIPRIGGWVDDQDRMKIGTHLAHSSDVLVPRLLVESEVVVEAEPDIVTVEAIGEFMEVEKMLF